MPVQVMPQSHPRTIDEAVMAEQHPDQSVRGVDAEEVREGVAALWELETTGVEVDGEIQVAESTWAIYGHISYDGEIVVGEYHDEAVAEAILRAAPQPHSDEDGPVP
jgi:hypothetical protein